MAQGRKIALKRPLFRIQCYHPKDVVEEEK